MIMKVGGGIVIKDGKFVVQCGGRADVVVRVIGTDGRELLPEMYNAGVCYNDNNRGLDGAGATEHAKES